MADCDLHTVIKAVELLRLQPGDTLIVKLPERSTRRDLDECSAYLRERLPCPVLVTTEAVAFSLVRQQPAEECG
jgi:hypothetical protein